MAEKEKNNGMLYDLILEQLSSLNDNYKKLSEDIQETNLAIGNLNNMKDDFASVKKNQEFFNRAMTVEDAKKIKEFYVNFNKVGESLEKFESDFKSIKEKIDDHEKFKTQIKTAIAIIMIILTAGITKEVYHFFLH